MFNFFVNKQKFSFGDIGLKCDVHSHILPGVDDGASDMEKSVGILSALSGAGVERVVLTPHVSGGLFPNQVGNLKARFEKFQGELPQELSSKLQFRLGSEYMIDEYFEGHDEYLHYNNEHILVEMSYSNRSINLLETIFDLGEDGYTPVLAHPERYIFYFGGKKPHGLSELEKLIDMGCKFQLNIQSLTGLYGPDSLNNVKYFLDHGWYSFVATDIHQRKQLDRFVDFKINARQFEVVRELAHNNEILF